MNTKDAAPIILAMTIAVAAAAQTGSPTSESLAVQLEAAVYQATVEGDIEGARKAFESIIAVAADRDRAIAAEALLRLAQANDAVDPDASRRYYERVIREYADQTEVAGSARAHLGAVDSTGTRSARLRPVLTEAIASAMDEHEYSPSGDRVVFLSPWNTVQDPARRGAGVRVNTGAVGVYLADLAGTLIRPLLTDWGPLDDILGPPTGPGSMQNLQDLRWSPDGALIAFSARRPSEAYLEILPELPRAEQLEAGRDAYVPAIFVVDATGGSPRQINKGELPGEGGLFEIWWYPDGDRLAYLRADGVYEISLAGETEKTLELPATRFMPVAGFSPDGRWLAFLGGGEDTGFDVFVMPAGGGRALSVARARGPGANMGSSTIDGMRPAWSADGRALFVASDASGVQNIWRVPFDPKTAEVGEPGQITFFADGSAGAPKPIRNGGGLGITLQQRRTVIRVAASSDLTDSRVVARGRLPLLSPDGRTVYYISTDETRPGIFAVGADGENPRPLASHNVRNDFYTDGFALSPDGETLVYRVHELDGQFVYSVATDGGTPQLLHMYAAGEPVGAPFFSPDGSTLAFTEGSGLYTMPVEGGEPTRIAQLWQWDGWSLRWSPDGELIAVLGWESPSVVENSVFVVPAAGGEPRRLTALRGTESAYLEGLEWHPDGERLSYFDYEIERTRLVDLDGNVSGPLFDHVEGWEYTGFWSPAGDIYYFDSSVDGHWLSFSFDVATGAIERLHGDGQGVSPVWSRDGSTFAWERNADGTTQFWLLEGVR